MSLSALLTFVTLTSVIFPPVTLTPISLEIGRFAALTSGLMVRLNGALPCDSVAVLPSFGSSPPHAVPTVSNVIATAAMAASRP